MVESVLEKIRMKCQKVFHTIHNYIDTDEMILRKSTIAAHAGEKVLIPINMRDGSVWRWEKAIQNSSSSQNRISINSSGMSPKSGEIESRLMLRTSAIFLNFRSGNPGICFVLSNSCAEGFVQTDGAAKLITGHSSEFSAYLNPFSNSYVEIFSFF